MFHTCSRLWSGLLSRLQVTQPSNIVMSNDPDQRLGRAANQNLGVTIDDLRLATGLCRVGTSVQGRR